MFRDLNVRGANPNGGTSEGAYNVEQETQHGFRIEGVDGVELDHVRVSDVYGDFVYIGRDKDRVPSQNVWIHDSTSARNGRQGIAVTAATNVIIERNTIRPHAPLDDRPRAERAQLAHLERVRADNTVGKGRLLFIASHGQGPVDDIVISGQPSCAGTRSRSMRMPPEGEAPLELDRHRQRQRHDGAQPPDAVLRDRRARGRRQHAAGLRRRARR